MCRTIRTDKNDPGAVKFSLTHEPSTTQKPRHLIRCSTVIDHVGKTKRG
jgi:hypothetical protein